jgi:release factor glutamine methyltransferase
MKNSALQFRRLSATDALREAVMALQHARIETASLDARLLLQHVLGISREQLLLNHGLSLTPQQGAHYQALTAKRCRRQPVAQLIGRREFWGMDFKVTPDTLDPRPDSETLIEAVLERLPERNRALTLLDLGTGSGCLLLALLGELPQAQGLGVDISEAALTVAKDNAAGLGLARRAQFKRSRWGDAVEGVFDVIVSNPPYIPTGAIAGLAPEVAIYEPKLALDGGADGLNCYRDILGQLKSLLAEDGVAALEIGRGQEKEVEMLARVEGLCVAGVKNDMAGITRCVVITINNKDIS